MAEDELRNLILVKRLHAKCMALKNLWILMMVNSSYLSVVTKSLILLIASAKVRNFGASSIPPCKSELYRWYLRADYITSIWKNFSTKSPLEHGWMEEEVLSFSNSLREINFQILLAIWWKILRIAMKCLIRFTNMNFMFADNRYSRWRTLLTMRKMMMMVTKGQYNNDYD